MFKGGTLISTFSGRRPTPDIIDDHPNRIHDAWITPITILSFLITMVLAEKIARAASRETPNTRWRDFADIVAIVRSTDIDGSTMHESLRVVAEHRKIKLRLLAEVLTGFANQVQTQWTLWLVPTVAPGSVP